MKTITKWIIFMISIVSILLVVISIGVYNTMQSQAAPSIEYVALDREGKNIFPLITDSQDLVNLFSLTPRSIQSQTAQAIKDAQDRLNTMIAIPDHERTFENTAAVLDYVVGASKLSNLRNILTPLDMLSPDLDVKKAAQDAIVTIERFFVDAITDNYPVYQAFKSFADKVDYNTLSDDQKYFVKETLLGFQRSGIGLPEQTREQVKQLKKELSQLQLTFEQNIVSDKTTILADLDELKGVDKEFIDQLQKSADGRYMLGVDYPTHQRIMETCQVAPTRKRMYQAFSNRAWPVNEQLLKEVIAKRDQLAHLLGFESYAAWELSNEMAQSPAVAHAFLDTLLTKSENVASDEYERFIKDLPESVTLSPEGKLHPWDVAFLKYYYKKNHLACDEEEISQYFPIKEALQGMLNIYEQFFNITFTQSEFPGSWHEDLSLITVSRDNTILGYVIFDLYPRANKFTHACHITVLPSVYDSSGKIVPHLSVLVTNFPKPIGEKPALLNRNDVNTFFHEFGHALHAILGRTTLATQSGTSVKQDFVEMPSQMLEEWLFDPQILRMISKHYKTGQPLPDDLIERILALQYYDIGFYIHRQGAFALLSLAYYEPGKDKDVNQVLHEIYARTNPHIMYDTNNHIFASFGHLMGYGARYYGYLWSKVYAIDLFDAIKKQGLLNPAVGQKYIDDVIGKGGSADPMDLLVKFLGRPPTQNAFIKHLNRQP